MQGRNDESKEILDQLLDMDPAKAIYLEEVGLLSPENTSVARHYVWLIVITLVVLGIVLKTGHLIYKKKKIS